MTPDYDKLVERAKDALVQLHHGGCDDAAAVIHDLMRAVVALKDRVDQLTTPEITTP